MGNRFVFGDINRSVTTGAVGDALFLNGSQGSRSMPGSRSDLPYLSFAFVKGVIGSRPFGSRLVNTENDKWNKVLVESDLKLSKSCSYAEGGRFRKNDGPPTLRVLP